MTKERLTSFYRTTDSLELDIPESYVREAKYLETKPAAQLTRELLKLKDAPTCIIYPDDSSSIGGRNAIVEAGLRIGGDISIAGYDGNLFSRLLPPTLTRLSLTAEKIGRDAPRLFLTAFEKPNTTLVQRVVIEGNLIPGQSVEDFLDVETSNT